MGTKHIRHLVTELAARLSDRDFLRKAGISRRTMQEIFVRDKWEEALESLFPIRERLSCKQILELCHPELWALSGEPEEGWISFTYKFSTHILYPDPEFSEKAASYARGAYVYLNVLQFFFDEERKAVPFDPFNDFALLGEEEYQSCDRAGEYGRFVREFRDQYIYEMMRLNREGDIRRQAAALIGKMFANFNAGYRKEIPADMADEVEALRAELMEAAAGADEELMEKFFDTMELSAEDMAKGLKIGVRDGSVCPVLCGSANTGLGVEMLLQTILDLAPVATDMPAEAAQDDDGNDIEVAFDPNGPTAAIVFKTISDQYGKYSMIKVIRGKVTGDMALYNPTTGNTEKLGRLYVMKGKKGEETKEICCGDIGAIGKMDKVKTGDTLCDAKNIVRLHGMDYAQPCYSRAISPKTKQEIEKLGTGLNKLNEEDPTFHVVNNAETHQTVISGAGDIQIDVLCAKLKSRFGVDAELSAPRVAYREKIRSTVRKQGRYKKQTGGSGQFGDVHIIFEPQTEQEDMIFEENVFGGSVPKNYFPAVEKGLRESCQHGVLAGYPVVFLKATLVDGSYHPVDSSEIAFKLAANLAFKAALPEAKPVLMEPIGELKVTIPDSYLGDVMGDLNKRRGRVMGMNPTGDGEQVLEAEVPMAEMMSYAIDLRSMTQSRGTFTFNFVRYEDCPAAAQEKAIAEAKALAEAE